MSTGYALCVLSAAAAGPSLTIVGRSVRSLLSRRDRIEWDLRSW